MNKWLNKTYLNITDFDFEIPVDDSFTISGIFIKIKQEMLEDETYFESTNLKKGENEQ